MTEPETSLMLKRVRFLLGLNGDLLVIRILRRMRAIKLPLLILR